MEYYVNKYIELRNSIPDWEFNGFILTSIEENIKYKKICEIFDKMDEIFDIVEKKYKINSSDFLHLTMKNQQLLHKAH